MQINTSYSLETESTHLLEIYHNIANGFYHLHHFLPLPTTNGYPLQSGVYLPTIPVNQIPHFWEQVSNLGPCIKNAISAQSMLAKSIQSYLIQLNLPTPTLSLDFSLLRSLNTSLSRLLPDIQLPTTLTIHPTYFGTQSSFHRSISPNEIVIYLRIDQNIAHLIETYLALVLQSTTSLKTPSRMLIKQSQQLLTQIGAPQTTKHPFTINNNCIYYSTTPLSNLTAREQTLLADLIKYSPHPLTYDEIADDIFVNDTKYSLEAISKVVSRLKAKLQELGISTHYIASASGVGYYLRN